MLEVHRQRTELRSTCWLSETKGQLHKWVLLTLWSRSTFLRVFYKWHFGLWLRRRKVKKQNDTKRMAVFYYWWKKEKHCSCLHNSEPVEEEDKRPQIEAKNITSLADKGCLAMQNIQCFEPNYPVNWTSESGMLTCQISGRAKWWRPHLLPPAFTWWEKNHSAGAQVNAHSLWAACSHDRERRGLVEHLLSTENEFYWWLLDLPKSESRFEEEPGVIVSCFTGSDGNIEWKMFPSSSMNWYKTTDNFLSTQLSLDFHSRPWFSSQNEYRLLSASKIHTLLVCRGYKYLILERINILIFSL